MKKNLSLSILVSRTFEVVLYFIIILFSLRIFVYQTTINSDITVHISIIDEFVKNSFYIPHPGFHLLSYFISLLSGWPYTVVVPIIMASLVTIIIITTKNIILWALPDFKYKIIYILAAVALSFVTAIYLPWFNKSIYLGQWGPNIWHSPTMFLVKPFALVSFWGMLVFIEKQDAENDYLIGIIASLLLLGSTFTKPSFIIAFMPALAIYLLAFRVWKLKLYLKVFLVLLPSILLLTYQFIETYKLQNSASYFHDKIIFTNFGVMKLYSTNIMISFVLAAAFPLSILFIKNKLILKNPYLLIAWLLVIVSFLQAGLLAEKYKFSQGAFIFGYIIALFILFVFSSIEYLSWYSKENRQSVRPIYIILAGIVGLLHLFSGIFYYVRLVNKLDWL